MEPVSVIITHVYDTISIDLDNLAKPVLDALKGIVLQDDEQVRELMIRKHELERVDRIWTFRPSVLAALDLDQEFLHVVVEQASVQEIVV